MAQFHKSAKVVIIGQGGIVGASVAHHLIERGWDNIIGIDKSGIPTDIGSTGHASDFCFNTMHDQMTIFTTRYSIDFFEKRSEEHTSELQSLMRISSAVFCLKKKNM